MQGNIYLNGTITMSSDRRMKKDIEPLDTGEALDEIAALRPVAFTWKKTGIEDMGLIAQEVDPVFPALVTHSGADENLALKYTSLIAPMIASLRSKTPHSAANSRTTKRLIPEPAPRRVRVMRRAGRNDVIRTF